MRSLAPEASGGRAIVMFPDEDRKRSARKSRRGPRCHHPGKVEPSSGARLRIRRGRSPIPVAPRIAKASPTLWLALRLRLDGCRR